jgi:hypothetical protein
LILDPIISQFVSKFILASGCCILYNFLNTVTYRKYLEAREDLMQKR